MFNTWRVSLRAIGWFPVITTAIVMIILLFIAGKEGVIPLFVRSRVVESVIPLAVTVQAAFLCSPADERFLELLLTYPRALTWIVVERLLVLVLLHGAIALIGNLLTGTVDVWRWIPPTIMLTGIAVYMTLRSRRAVFGVLVSGMTWFVFCFFAPGFVPGIPVMPLLERLQPLLWPVNLYLQPGWMPPDAYLLNRTVVMGIGGLLIALALYWLRDEEWLLGHQE